MDGDYFTIDSVLGQEKAKKMLRRAVSSNRLGHAYLFRGPAGVGKKRSSKTEEYRSVIERMVSFVPYKRIEQEAVMEAITIDKKRSGSNLRLVLLEQPGKPVISSSVTIAQLRRATSMMLDYYKAFGGKNA